MKRFFVVFLLLLLMSPSLYGADPAATDEGQIGESWVVRDGGDILPSDTATSDIGATDATVAEGHFDSIYLGGTAKTSWGSVVSPMTDATGYVYPTDSGGVYRLYDAGYLSLGAGTAVDVYVLFDTDDDDFYMGRDDTDNDFAIGVGSTLGTDERISITDDATATIVVIGDGVNAEDKQITFDGANNDFYIAYDDSADDLLFGVDATVGSKPCFSIMDESTPLLYVHNGIDGFGAVDIDYGSADVTDHTFVSDGGTLVLDGTITLTNLDIISNATDDTIRVASEDAASTLEVFSDLSSGDAILKLSAGDGDAAGEQWTITSDQSSTDLVFGCDDVSTGDELTRFTISDAGVVTTMAALNAVINDASNTTVTDVLNITHSTSGTAAAGIGASLTFDIENGTGTVEEHASFDVVSAVATNGAEDTDFVINLMTNGALAEVFRIDNDNEAAAGAVFELTSWTEETNGVIDVLSLTLDNSADTATDDFGAGISVILEQEDSGTPIEQASIDFVLTDAGTGAEDSVIRFSCMIAGVLDQIFEIDGDAGLIVGSGADVDYTITFDTDDKDGVIQWMADEDNFTIDDEVLLGDVTTVEVMNYALDTGNASGVPYTVTLDPAPVAQAAGMIVVFKVSDANSGACSLNVNALGAAQLYMLGDQDLGANHLESGAMAVAVFDGTNWQLINTAQN